MGTVRLAIRRPDDIPDSVFLNAMDDFLQVLIELTPVDTGFAASSWEMAGDENLMVFYNNAEYSSYLDDGWSQQAPDGMTDPALEQLPNILDEWLLKYYKY